MSDERLSYLPREPSEIVADDEWRIGGDRKRFVALA